MNVIFYSLPRIKSGKRLQRTIEMLISKENIEVYRTVVNLALRLRQSLNEFTVIVLLASSRKDLQGLISLGDLLHDRKTILILPNGDKDTIAKAHTLRPRFISYCDVDFLDVSGVLSKMMCTSDIKKSAIIRIDNTSHNVELMCDKRKFERYDIEVPVRIEVTASKRGKRIFDLQTVNLSAKGSLFRTMESLPEGTKFRADILIPFDESKEAGDTENALVIRVTGRVLRSGASGIAVCFNEDYQIITREGFVKQEDLHCLDGGEASSIGNED